MELKDVIIVAVIFIVITLIITIAKGRKKQYIGYLSNITKANFRFGVGILKIDYSNTFCIIIENKGTTDISLKDIYLEIKEGSKYNKHELPVTAYDSSKELVIPGGKSGGAMMPEKEFKKLFSQVSELKAVVVLDDNTVLRSQILLFDSKKRELKAK